MSFRRLVEGLALRILAQEPREKTGAPVLGATAEEALAILESSDEDLLALLDAADRVRRRFLGNTVRFCAIINARSGACAEDCAFCAQSAHHRTTAPTYPLLSPERVRDAALAARRAGAYAFSVVTSGLGPGDGADVAALARVVRAVREEAGMRACLSAGILDAGALEAMKEAGLAHFHHNLEAAESFYPTVCSTREWAENVRAVREAKAAGLSVCVGGIFGMGETDAQRVELIRSIVDLDPDSVPINFLNPIPGTPLEGRPLVPPRDALRIIAAVRLSLPDKHITLCGGREVTLRDLQPLAILAGASGLLVGDYLTTPGRPAAEDIRMAHDLGLTIADA